MEGDELRDIYFNTHGKNGFILKKFHNTTYITINQSSTFGFEDITANLFERFEDASSYKESFLNWYELSKQYKRIFTVQCQE